MLPSQSTSEMKMAKQAEFELVDKELNAQYQRVLDSQDERGKINLKAAQDAWLKFRDVEAEFAAYWEHDGTAAALAYLDSQIERAKLRGQQAETYSEGALRSSQSQIQQGLPLRPARHGDRQLHG